MAQEIIDVSTPNDGQGDELRNANIKSNNNFTELYATKEDKVTGKGLSTNDFTDALETKLIDFDPNANANVQVDWAQQVNTEDDYIKNKPLQTDAISESKQHITFSFPLNDKTDLDSLHGTFLINDSESGQILNSGTDITGQGGVSKVMMVVLAGSDVIGDLIISGTSVDRVTAIETPGDTETVAINGLSTDNSTTDSNGNVIHDYEDNYISTKFWKGSLTFSTPDLDITNIKFAQIAFEQFDDVSDITISSFDSTYKISNSNAKMDAYLYAVTVLGNKSNITKIAEIHHATGEEVDAVYRRRQKELDIFLNGEVSGVFVDLYLSPSNFEYFSNFVMKVWATLKLPSTLFVDGDIAGARTYLELEDTDSSRVGKAGFAIIVNPGETADEYAPFPITSPLSTKELLTATAAQTLFVLSTTPTNIDVWADRVYQIESIDYTLAGNQLTMTDGQDSGTKLVVRKY
jgi:hypothetical protein